NARARAAQTRQRARARMNGRRAGAARRHERSSAVGAAIAVVFFLMLFGGAVAGALLLMPASNRTVSSTTVYDDGTVEIHRRGAFDPMPEMPETPEMAPSMGKSLGVSMLVVSDLAYPLHDQIAREIANGIVALRNEGIDLQGDLVTNPALLDAEESERQIGLLAEAERRRGSSPIDSIEFLSSVHDLLDAHDELDMVLWLASNPKDEATFRYALVSRERDSGGVSDEHTLGVILDTARLCSE
ncbi:MAG: hypothetical protein ACIARR_06315, partial [Phycisphaerales bacterium JB059]